MKEPIMANLKRTIKMTDFKLDIINNEFRIDSRLLAPELNHRHRTIFENVLKYQDKFEEHGLLPFKTEAVNNDDARGVKYQKYALLNEDQCYFLLTLMRNNDFVVDKKSKLVKAFRQAKNQVALRDMARIEGKAVRRTETDAIKDLVEYATAKGSSNAKMYYASITKMTNDLLGIESGMRDQLDHKQLQQIKVAETIVEMAIRDGLKAELNYKDIYKLCKDRVSAISSVLLG